MVQHPIIVLIELFAGIIRYTIDGIVFIITKIAEFFYSIYFYTGNVIFSSIIFLLVFGMIFYLIRKRLWGDIQTVIIFGIIIAFLILITVLFMIS